MAAKGEKYKHNSVTDVTYTVQKVTTTQVFLIAPGSGMVRITLAQLAANYTKVS